MASQVALLVFGFKAARREGSHGGLTWTLGIVVPMAVIAILAA